MISFSCRSVTVWRMWSLIGFIWIRDENGITMNSYFVQHPEMVLGTMRMESSRFGMDSVCKADNDRPLSELLAEAVQRINGGNHRARKRD